MIKFEQISGTYNLPRVKTGKRKMSRQRRNWIFQLRMGLCGHCDKRIHQFNEPWRVAHMNPLFLCHDDSDGNLWPAHEACELKVTAEVDLPMIAKVRRVAIKNRGEKVARNILAGSKRHALGRKMSGETFKRETLPDGPSSLQWGESK